MPQKKKKAGQTLVDLDSNPTDADLEKIVDDRQASAGFTAVRVTTFSVVNDSLTHVFRPTKKYF